MEYASGGFWDGEQSFLRMSHVLREVVEPSTQEACFAVRAHGRAWLSGASRESSADTCPSSTPRARNFALQQTAKAKFQKRLSFRCAQDSFSDEKESLNSAPVSFDSLRISRRKVVSAAFAATAWHACGGVPELWRGMPLFALDDSTLNPPLEVTQNGSGAKLAARVIRLDVSGKAAGALSGNARALAQLTSRIGWDNTELDCARLLSRKSCLSVGICRQDTNELISTASLTVFLECCPVGAREPSLGWLSYVVTHPEFRRQGLARRACEHVLAAAREKFPKLTAIGLYGSAAGAPLYQSLGFRSFGEAVPCSANLAQPFLTTFAAAEAAAALRDIAILPLKWTAKSNSELLARVLRTDRDLVGFDREAQLTERTQDYGEMAWCAVESQGSGKVCGYAFGRRTANSAGDVGVAYGPVWAQSETIAAELVRRVLLSGAKSLAASSANLKVFTLVPSASFPAGSVQSALRTVAPTELAGVQLATALGLKRSSYSSQLMICSDNPRLAQRWAQSLSGQLSASSWEYG